ncbi:MAG: Flp family type IVb pilin [Pseudomonadota bacterium]
MEKLIKFFKDEEGVTAIEYGLIAAFIAIAIIVFLPTIRTALSTVFSTIASALEGAT